MRKAASWERVALRHRLGPGRDSRSGEKNQYGLHLSQWSLAPLPGVGYTLSGQPPWAAREERTSAPLFLSEKGLILFFSVGSLLGALWKETEGCLFLPLLWFV